MRCAGLITLSKRLPKHMDSKLLADSWAAIELNIEKLGPLLKQVGRHPFPEACGIHELARLACRRSHCACKGSLCCLACYTVRNIAD